MGEPLAFAIIGLGEGDAYWRRPVRALEQGLELSRCCSSPTAKRHGAGIASARPFRFSALLARLYACWARSRPPADDAAVRIGPYTFHPSAKLLQADGRKVRLTEKETNILKFLHASAGTVPRDILLHEVWGYGPAVATHTLETHIYRLRKKIEPDPASAVFSPILLTEWRLPA